MATAVGRNALQICCSCWRLTASRAARIASYSSQHGDASTENDVKKKKNADANDETEELGPMARRLQEATEEALLTGGRAGRQAVEDAGFSEELKERLMSKIADAKFKNEFAEALAKAGIPSNKGSPRGGSFGLHQPWTGEERTEDAVLRMLDDAKRPLKAELRGKYQPGPIDMRLKRAQVLSPGQKVASARDKVSAYSGMGLREGKGLSDKEKEEMRTQFRERFQPEGRTRPISISAIESMANERIENAIARGQFKDIPRGTKVERDPQSGNPFVNTTEYLMNRMIQRQDLVPPWIEKQQELVREANAFRARLRSDWKRHAARMISSKGGTMLEQMKRAELYAAAEQVHNPRQRGSDQIAGSSTVSNKPDAPLPSIPETGLPRPFRDPAWEKTEEKYMTLAVERLNSMTRSYNLMAPELARKPYFSLARELAVCYSTVAPLLANEIKNRATKAPPSRLGGGGQLGNEGSMPDKSVGKGDAKIHVEANEKAFGLKEWWRDFWKN